MVSIHIVDNVNTYKVHGICPARGGTDNGPGGDPRDGSARRPVAKRGGGDLWGQRPISAYESYRMVPDSVRLNGATAPVLYSRCNSYPTVSYLAPTPYIPEIAGGYEVPGDGGRGAAVDVWL